MDTTCDGILGKRIVLAQPRTGFRVAVDTVLLAAAAPSGPGEGGAGLRGIDLGCGVGGAMLCWMARVSSARAFGVEIQPDLAALCRDNLTRNGFAGRGGAVCGDVLRPGWLAQGQAFCGGGGFDVALMNPPYHSAVSHDVSPDAARRRARTDDPGDLEGWARAGAVVLRDGGVAVVIHRADRAEEVLQAFHAAGFGGGVVWLVQPRSGDAASRAIFRLRKGGYAGDVVPPAQALVLHRAGGGFTDEAEAVLRHAGALA